MHQVTIKRYCWKNVRKHEIAYTSPFLPHSFCQDWRIQPKDGVMSACFAIIFIQSFDINLTIYPVFQQYMICSGIIHGELIESMRVSALFGQVDTSMTMVFHPSVLAPKFSF